jgi:hypothetical protein
LLLLFCHCFHQISAAAAASPAWRHFPGTFWPPRYSFQDPYSIWYDCFGPHRSPNHLDVALAPNRCFYPLFDPFLYGIRSLSPASPAAVPSVRDPVIGR